MKRIRVEKLIVKYREAGCPKPNLVPRTRDYTKPALDVITRGLGERDAGALRIPHCIEYRQWRGRQATKGDGARSAEIELAALSSAMNWGVSVGLLDFNGIKSGRPRFVEKTTHCRERAFASSDELWAAANALMENERSRVLGFQLLVEAMTGLRTNEALALRIDEDPGRVEGNALHVRRSKRGVNPYVVVHETLGKVIEKHRIWHAGRSKWWFPSSDLVNPVSRTSLTHALARVAPGKTSHGLRSFYVTVRRSQGAPDQQIAAEIGDSTVGLISRTYGDAPPNWVGREPMTWGEPQWKF